MQYIEKHWSLQDYDTRHLVHELLNPNSEYYNLILEHHSVLVTETGIHTMEVRQCCRNVWTQDLSQLVV